MRSFAIVKIAFWALGRNKMRSVLTMLGIIIGVGAVISLVSIGQGAQYQIQQSLETMGSNVLYVMPRDNRDSGARGSNQDVTDLTTTDLYAILAEVPVVAAGSPVVNSDGQLIFGRENQRVRVQGVNEQFLEVRDWDLSDGSMFTEQDIENRQRVLVIGAEIVQELFQGVDPIGQKVRLRNQPFTVIGTLASKGQSGVGQNQDETVLTPYTTAQRKLQGQSVERINQGLVKIVSQEAMPIGTKLIGDLIRSRHEIQPGMEDDFEVANMSEVAEAAEQSSLVMTLMLGSIAMISLVVGGIGIMNIMLVSVTERTREIGIRMAVGSRPGYIRLQFLAESIMMSMAGGLIGVGIGAFCATYIGPLLGFTTWVSPESVAVSFGFAAAVGVFFGYYPAHKAAGLDPIDALRYE